MIILLLPWRVESAPGRAQHPELSQASLLPSPQTRLSQRPYSHQQRMRVPVAPSPGQHSGWSAFQTVAILTGVEWYVIMFSLNRAAPDTGTQQCGPQHPGSAAILSVWREMTGQVGSSVGFSQRARPRPDPQPVVSKREVSPEWRQDRGIRAVQCCPCPPLGISPRTRVGITKSQELVGPRILLLQR